MPDRPVECSQCKKKASVVYKEITEESIIITEMCPDCPVLEKRLHGDLAKEHTREERDDNQATGVACGTCGTSLEWIKMGNPVGCTECYDVFSDILISQLLASDRIPLRLKKNVETKRHLPLHLGKSPTKFSGAVPSEKLTSLNDALKEALKKENYEQAAWLRDQIKALLDKKENGTDETPTSSS